MGKRRTALARAASITACIAATLVTFPALAQIPGFPPGPQPQPPPATAPAPGGAPSAAPSGPYVAPRGTLLEAAPEGAPSGKKRRGRGKGILVVESEPSGATVYVDGKKRGETPLTLQKETVGWAELRLTHPDRGDIRGFAEIEKDLVNRVGALLPPPVGALTVLASGGRTDVRVQLNGKDYGVAPLSIRNIPTGEVRIRASSRLDTLEETVKITKGETRLLRLKFKARPKVRITVRQQRIAGCAYMDASVTVGGKSLGTVANGGELLARGLDPGPQPYALSVRGRCGGPENTWSGSGTIEVRKDGVYSIVGGTQPGQVLLR